MIEDNKIVKLVTQKEQENQEICEDIMMILETFIDLTKQNKLKGIAIVAHGTENNTYTSCSMTDNIHRVISGLEIIKQQLITEYLDE